MEYLNLEMTVDYKTTFFNHQTFQIEASLESKEQRNLKQNESQSEIVLPPLMKVENEKDERTKWTEKGLMTQH